MKKGTDKIPKLYDALYNNFTRDETALAEVLRNAR